MKAIKLKKDLLSKDGRLLLAKGNGIIMSADNILRFNNLGVLDDVIEATSSESESKKNHNISYEDEVVPLEEISNQVEKSKMHVYKKLNFDAAYEKIFYKSSNLVQDLIYNHKNEKWYRHFITLTYYVRWLYAHSINTALISCIIGHEMNYDEGVLRQVALGALLHDLGLMLLPKKILMKPGKLTNLEMEIVKRHCELGYSMLQECGLSDVSKNIILQHHENMDGSGYPNGLVDEDIDIESKIVMIAESFDTATTARPYKNEVAVNVAIEKMINSPNIYDPDIVSILSKFSLSGLK